MDNSFLVDGNDEPKTKGWSISQKYETIIVGDAYCGKTTYLNELIKTEHDANSPIMLSDDNNKIEFWVEHKTRKAIFVVRDTASM
jgi:GTPase SAR1 family protein